MSEASFHRPQCGAKRCLVCQQVAQTRPVTFRHNVAWIIARQTYTTKGELCRSCVHKTLPGICVEKCAARPVGHGLDRGGTDLLDHEHRRIPVKKRGMSGIENE